MNRASEPFIRIPHRIFSHELWTSSPHGHLRVFLALCHRASWKPSRIRANSKWHSVETGEAVASRRGLAEMCRLTEGEVRAALRSLEAAELIRVRAVAGRFSIITVSDLAGNPQNNPQNNPLNNPLNFPAKDSREKTCKNRPSKNNPLNNPLNSPLNSHVIRSEEVEEAKKGESARVEAAAPPSPSDPPIASKGREQVKATLMEVAAIWNPNRRGDLRYAQRAWATAAAAFPDGVEAWCQKVKAAAVAAVEGYAAARTKEGGIPKLESFVADGHYELPPPQPWYETAMKRKPRFDPSSLEVDHEAERLKAAAAPAPVTTASSTPAPRPMKRLIDYYPEAPAPAVAAAPAQVPTMPSNPAPAQTRKGSMKAVGALMGSAAPKPRGCRCVDGMVLRDDATLNDVLGHSGDPHRGKIPCPDCSGKRQQVTAAHAVSAFLASPPPASSPAPL